MHPLQEKFQVTVPYRGDGADDEPWVFPTPRDVNGQQAFRNCDPLDVDERKFNKTPPGMELDNQNSVEIRRMPLVMSGTSDASMDTNPESFARGYTKRQMKGSDDQYTGEHVDHFYGDAGGFVERNNYLDRE